MLKKKWEKLHLPRNEQWCLNLQALTSSVVQVTHAKQQQQQHQHPPQFANFSMTTPRDPIFSFILWTVFNVEEVEMQDE
ncbi:hypothetical protein T4B_10541 [Trichinella pseudospiralis]|uniref:Uncharacterized protein n=1 Tax=Trichinella pseudospiralis TaxID=6337 RepID=A0A0V1E1Z8_TRIPS|nr:hypothetical protein T4A_6728 [Trichinella pseudospiralis]KRZ22894.1 hypothetical protein T4B_10541 [Trichinella pseudospiralis]KRZ39700.1 hypothetical protein T4C_6520 [Trichinella pseudospiralis]